MKQTAAEEFPSPLLVTDLTAFLQGLPDEAVNFGATVDIVQRTEGQRDPVVTGYIVTCRWNR